MGFRKIKGQDSALEILKKIITSNHLSHAYLFVGPKGVGKKSTALAFAQVINCLDGENHNGDSCRQCLSCKKIESGNHPDVEVIEPEGSSIKIDQVRNLRNRVFYKCYESKFKVIIFDEADFLTIEAANSLLKVLEEPPENNIFILVTAEPQQLPETIISRCQQIQFQAIPAPIIKEILLTKYPNLTEQINLAANLARGSLAQGEKLLQEGELMEKREEVIAFLKNIFNLSPSEIVLWCEKWDKDKKAVKTILEMVQFWFRDLLVWRTTGEDSLLINQDCLKDIKNSQHTQASIDKAFNLIKQSYRSLEYNASPRLVLEVLFLALKEV